VHVFRIAYIAVGVMSINHAVFTKRRAIKRSFYSIEAV